MKAYVTLLQNDNCERHHHFHQLFVLNYSEYLENIFLCVEKHKLDLDAVYFFLKRRADFYSEPANSIISPSLSVYTEEGRGRVLGEGSVIIKTFF